MRFSLLLFLTLAACDPHVCTRNSDCAHGLVCGEEDTCVVPPDMTKVDMAEEDASTDLSIASDLSTQDVTDLASFDGGTTD